MAFSQSGRIPSTPTLPTGEPVASYRTYLEAQKAVDLLADKAFPVQHVTIVGTDLRMVERVLRRLSYPSAALGGFASGAWFGLFVGLLLTLFSPPNSASVLLPAILFGGAFGLLFSVITYAMTRNRRDFASASQIVASSYTVLCHEEHAHRARSILQEVGGVVGGAAAAPSAPVGPPPSDPAAHYPVPGGAQTGGAPHPGPTHPGPTHPGPTHPGPTQPGTPPPSGPQPPPQA
ncbi:general stress protein [Cellulomonas telluris]|uniref:general stress protein n=1 Tax=Cellulomonas telluris TaxID=2306636 RepID=UPI001FE7E472|nr:general stress protein [Cellulomonas telluris]